MGNLLFKVFVEVLKSVVVSLELFVVSREELVEETLFMEGS